MQILGSTTVLGEKKFDSIHLFDLCFTLQSKLFHLYHVLVDQMRRSNFLERMHELGLNSYWLQ